MESWKKYLAEFFGTACLVIFGCGTAAIYDDFLATALAFGLVIVVMSYSIGSVSGAHLNPAVSLAMLINGKIDLIDFFGYVIFQILGSVIGASVLLALLGSGKGFGANSLKGVDGSAVKGLSVEIVLTFVFVFVILALTLIKGNESKLSGIIIGFTLTLVHLFGIKLTGTSVNPARSIGPALLEGGSAVTQLWVFIVGPLVGAALAAGIFKIITMSKSSDEDEDDAEDEEDEETEEAEEAEENEES